MRFLFALEATLFTDLGILITFLTDGVPLVKRKLASQQSVEHRT
jgi:hypothetical protein